MIFKYAVEVEVKNDAATQEMGEQDMALMILGILEDNKLSSVPWVIGYHYHLVKE